MLRDIAQEKLLDARDIPCEARQSQVFSRARGLVPGDYFVLVNTINPVPMRYLLEDAHPGCFTWDYLQNGPDLYAVRISRAVCL